MAKILEPDFIALQVRDLAAAKSFYMERLGLIPMPDSPPNAVVFDTTPIPFAIRLPSVDLNASQHLGWGVALWLSCDDAEGLHSSLQQNNVTIIQQPFDGPFGRTFSFADLEGYTITVHQNRS